MTLRRIATVVAVTCVALTAGFAYGLFVIVRAACRQDRWI